MIATPERLRRVDAATIARFDRAEAILFDFVLIAFAGLITWSALGLKAGPGMVPLAIGIPTLLALIVQLVRDLLPPRTSLAKADAGAAEAGSDGISAWLAVGLKEEQAEELPTTIDARWRQFVLTGWVLSYVAAALVVGLLFATPPALFAILFVTTRRIRASLAITAITCVALYVVFVQLLRVPV